MRAKKGGGKGRIHDNAKEDGQEISRLDNRISLEAPARGVTVFSLSPSLCQIPHSVHRIPQSSTLARVTKGTSEKAGKQDRRSGKKTAEEVPTLATASKFDELPISGRTIKGAAKRCDYGSGTLMPDS